MIDKYFCEACKTILLRDETVEKTTKGRRMDIVERCCPTCGRQVLSVLSEAERGEGPDGGA